MYYSLVNFPQIENENFHQFRNKYDPFVDLLPAHVAFIFPVPISIGLTNLKNHIQKIVDDWSPINCRFNELEKTFDHWLMLIPSEGRSEIIQLHDELYQGILAPFLREDLPYSPHIGLGFFSTEKYDYDYPTTQLTLDETNYKKALRECKNFEFDFRLTIDKLTLIEVNETFTTSKNICDFNLAFK